MSSIKLKHASGNSMSLAAPATNPASDLSLKLPATIGSANQLLKNSGTAGTLEFSSLVEDSSGNVGIGTATPSSFNSDGRNLVVGTGSGGQGLSIYSANNNYGSIYFADGTSGDALYRGAVLYNHTSDFLRFDTAAGEKFRIDSSGNVTKPYNPVFRVNGAHGWVTLNQDASLILPFSNELLDVGSNYDTSNYRFTAPVAGKYYINVSLYWKATSAATSNYITLEFQKNGSANSSGIDYGIYGTANDTTGSQYLTTDSIQELSASDYVDVKIFARGANIDYYMGHSQFNGFLIG